MTGRYDFYPMLLRPAYRRYLWGGERLARLFARAEQGGVIAESWECSDRDEGPTFIDNGSYANRMLFDLHGMLGEELAGRRVERMPLLIKLLDAERDLSIQVHPDERRAPLFRGEAKTEAWVVMAAMSGAFVYAGFGERISEERLREAIDKETLPSLLHRIDVEEGDAIFIPGGTVHAIGAGCVIFEVQQNSDTTYRLFDYGRRDTKGKRRKLHVKEALATADLSVCAGGRMCPAVREKNSACEREELISCPYFRIERVWVYDRMDCGFAEKSFTYYFIAGGGGRAETDHGEYDLSYGRSYLFPYGLKRWQLKRGEGSLCLLRVSLQSVGGEG
ncbi:MAG: class I mannose-6-phosphate isomerase [Simkaniaceae bacterium]|nr:class I mannose-6-phosphate isomerase [Simkaniaceae bacterium]